MITPNDTSVWRDKVKVTTLKDELFTYAEVKRAFHQLNMKPRKTYQAELDMVELKMWGLKVGDSIFEAMQQKSRVPKNAFLVGIAENDMRNTINILYSFHTLPKL